MHVCIQQQQQRGLFERVDSPGLIKSRLIQYVLLAYNLIKHIAFNAFLIFGAAKD